MLKENEPCKMEQILNRFKLKLNGKTVDEYNEDEIEEMLEKSKVPKYVRETVVFLARRGW